MATIDLAEGAPSAARREFQIGAYLQMARRHRRLLALGAAGGLLAGLLVALATSPSFRASALVDVQREAGSPLAPLADAELPASDPQLLATETRLIAGRDVALVAARKLNPSGASEEAAAAILGAIAVAPVRGTSLVEVSATARTPRRGAELANAVADAYIDWRLDARFRTSGQLGRFLAKEIEKAKAELAEREQRLLAFGKEKDILAVDPGTGITLQKLEALDRDLASAFSDRLAREARLYETRTAPEETLLDPSSAALVGQLRAEQARLEREYADQLAVFKPEWPAMGKLRAQIEKGRQHLAAVTRQAARKVREQARAEYQAALKREQGLREALARQRSEAQSLGENAVTYGNLKVEVEARKALDELLKRQADNAVTERLQGKRFSSLRVVERAVPPRSRFRPSVRNDALVWLLAGLLAPATAPAAARKGPPAIELLPFEMPHTAVAEAYRALRTSLLLSRADGVRLLAATSALPLEGKTSTAANLAVVLGQLGRRVLLVDADLHKPRLHEVFRASNRPGLASILAERLA